MHQPRTRAKALALGAALTAFISLAAAPASAGEVGVSIQISQPGVYGRVDIGRFPQPQVVVQRPVVIVRPAVTVPDPVYLWVPPGHRQNWRRHCAEYRACGVPVYFVRDDWYGRTVKPHRHERWDADRDGRPDRHQRDDRHDDRRFDRGPDRGHGYGRGPSPDEGPGRGPGRGPDRRD